MNPNWIRWIHSSLITYFTNYFKADKGIALQIEGQDRKVSGKEDWLELSWDGPRATELNSGCWNLELDINVLVSSIVSRDDTYKHKRNVGTVQAAFIKGLPIYKYGNIIDVDDQSYFECLQIKDSIETSYFGKVETDILLEQSTVEAHYRLSLIG